MYVRYLFIYDYIDMNFGSLDYFKQLLVTHDNCSQYDLLSTVQVSFQLKKY